MNIQRQIMILSLLVLLAGASYYALAQHRHEGEGSSQSSDVETTSSASQPSHQHGIMETGMMEEHHASDGSMTKEMQMPSGMMKRHQILMQSQVATTDPQAVLALKQDLELSDSQVEQLNSILQEARKKSLNLLNAEQKSQLDEIPDAPHNMQQAMMKMHGRMQSMDGKKDAGMSSETCCPGM